MSYNGVGHVGFPTFFEVSPIILAVVDEYFRFISTHQTELVTRTIEHIQIIVQAIAVAIPLGVSLGIVITFNRRLATVVIWLAGIMMTIPSIALFGLLIPYLGIGQPPVVFALILYAQLPVVRNTYIGLTQIDPAAIEAGRGLGMTQIDRLRQVQLPMALPVIMAGVRNAVVILIGIAAIGAFIGAGGLGFFIFDGIDYRDVPKIVVATVVLSLLTLSIDYLFSLVERYFRARNGEDVTLPRLFAPFVEADWTP